MHDHEQPENASRGWLVFRGLLQFGLSFGIWGGLLFWSAGTWLWPRAWLHLTLWVVTLAANFGLLLATNPAILRARTKRQRFAERSDFLLMVCVVTPATLAIPLAAGLDAVRAGALPLPFWTVYPALACHVLGDAVMVWAMAVNPYGEKAVRVQAERAHRTVTNGPYAVVRHPMYAGAILILAGIPLMLGSGWAFVPVAVVTGAIVWRTVFEDRLLQRGLPGYADYAAQVRCRMLPGIW